MDMAKRWATAYLGGIALTVVAVDVFGTKTLFGWIGVVPFADKLGHLLLIGGAALALALLFPLRPWRLGRIAFLPTSLVLALVMVAEEASQIGLSTRSADPWDMVANLVGILVADGVARNRLRCSRGHVPVARP